ncbi:MAG: hypothetical protein ACYCV6_12045 [Steroidobacteraceae bacterium]
MAHTGGVTRLRARSSVVFGDVEATNREKKALASKKALVTPGYSPLEEGVVNFAEPAADHPCEQVDVWKVVIGRQPPRAGHPRGHRPSARRARDTRTREGALLRWGYKSLRAEWAAENERKLHIGRDRPHSQKDYSALRLAHLEIEAERCGARRERSTHRGRRETHRTRQERDRARGQRTGARGTTGGGRQDWAEYNHLREVMGLFTGTRAAAGQSGYMEAKRHAGDAA